MRTNTLKKLRSFATKRGLVEDANLRRGSYSNPDPTLPPQDYLEGSWLTTTIRSNPHLENEAKKLVSIAKERSN